MTTVAASETGVHLRELTGAINLDTKSRLSDIRGLQQLRVKMGARGMFGAEEIPNGEWKEPNFDELKEITDRMDWAGARKTALQDKTAKYKDITEGNLTPVHLKIIGKVLADMPGMVMALAKEAGVLDPSSIAAKLRDGTFIGTSLKPIIERFGKDNQFGKRLKTFLADIKLTPEEAGYESTYKVLTEEVGRRTSSLTEKKRSVNEAEDWYKALETSNSLYATNFEKDIKEYDEYVEKHLRNANLPGHLKRNIILDRGDADTYLASLTTYTPAPGAETTAVNNAIAYATRIKDMYNLPYFNQDNMRRMRTYLKKGALDAEIYSETSALGAKEKELAELKVKRKTALEGHGHKIDIALETAVKQYYNDILLAQAKKIAQAEAGYKAGETSKEGKVDEILKKYLTYGFFKFNRKGEPKGFDNKWIKKSAKAIKRNGPEGMARLMMERIISQRRRVSPQLRAEIDTLLKEINPENPEKPWEMVSSDHLKKMGEENTAKLLGYAYAKNYWWDRIRFSQSQAEFIAANYTADFWDTVFNNKDSMAAKTLLSKAIQPDRDIVNMDDGQFKAFIREKLGENSVEFTKKLLKVAPYALAAGAVLGGAYFGLPAVGITGNSVAAAAGEVGKAIVGAATAVKTTVEGAVGAVGGALGATGQNVGNILATGPAGVGQTVGEALKGAADVIGQTAGGVATGTNQAVQGVGQGLGRP